MSAEDKTFIRSWLTDCRGGNALLILTPTGSGISSWLFDVAIPAHGMESVSINPDTSKIKAQIHDAYTSTITPLGMKKILVLQGFDVLVNDSTMLTDVTNKLKDPGVPTVCIGHVSRTVEKKFVAMFKTWDRRVIHVMPKVCDIMDILRAAKGDDRQEGYGGNWGNVEKSDETLTKVAATCRGDIRQAMIRQQYDEFHAKDDFYEAEEVMTQLRQGSLTCPNDIHRAARGDRQVLSLAMFESYDPLQCLSASDMYSFLDGMPKEIQENHDWYDYLLVTYPALHYKPRKTKTTSTKFSYGMIWSKSHLNANRYKQAKTASREFAVPAMRPVYQIITDEFPFYRSMMMSFVECQPSKGKSYPPRWVGRGMDPKSVLKVMRLWKTPWYNHTKTMKWIQSSTNESKE
jgi:hypothetical protein